VRHLRRFRRWRRYRRYLAALVRDDRRAGVPLTRDRLVLLKQEARVAAGLT
jgi:hypothetical protein